MSIPYYILAIFITAAFITDLRTSRIPNRLTFISFLIALGYYYVMEGWSGVAFSLIGSGAGMGIFLILYAFKALGAGDVKLFGAIGALMGIEFALYSMMYSVLYAGVIGLLILFVRKQLLRRMVNVFYYILGIFLEKNLASFNYTKKYAITTFPFMYAVLPGIVTTSYYFLRS